MASPSTFVLFAVAASFSAVCEAGLPSANQKHRPVAHGGLGDVIGAESMETKHSLGEQDHVDGAMDHAASMTEARDDVLKILDSDAEQAHWPTAPRGIWDKIMDSVRGSAKAAAEKRTVEKHMPEHHAAHSHGMGLHLPEHTKSSVWDKLRVKEASPESPVAMATNLIGLGSAWSRLAKSTTGVNLIQLSGKVYEEL